MDIVNIEVKFSEKYFSFEDLRVVIEVFLLVMGGLNFLVVLIVVKEVFEDSGVCENVVYVFVVILDKRFGVSEENVKNVGKLLEDFGILVVFVVIGNEVDEKELEWVISDEDNVIDVNVDEEFEILMEMILVKINGTLLLLF